MPSVSEILPTAAEVYVDRSMQVSDAATQLNYGSWFVFKGQLHSTLTDFFTANEGYFYLASFITNILAAILYFIKFLLAENKNATKIANLMFRVFSLGLIAIMMAGAAILGAAVVSALLMASVMIFPIVQTAKTLFFAIKCLLTSDKKLQDFFYNKMIKNIAILVVSGILVVGLTALYFFAAPIAAVAVPLLTAISLIGLAVMVIAQVWKVSPFIADIPFIKKIADVITPIVEKITDAIKSLICYGSKKETKPSDPLSSTALITKIIPPVEKFNFYQYAVTPAVVDVPAFLQEIKDARAAKPHTLKGEALAFLQTFVEKMDELPANAESAAIKIADADFNYQNKEELVHKIKAHVHKHHPGVFQSCAKYKGRTQAFFEAAYAKFLEPEPLSARATV